MKKQTSMSQSITDKDHLKKLVKQLKIKLQNFAVMDKQGELLGTVKDFNLDNKRQIALVVSKTVTETNRDLLFLASKHIKKIDTSNQSIFLDVERAEIEHLPEVATKEISDMEIGQPANFSGTPAPEADLWESSERREPHLGVFADNAKVEESTHTDTPGMLTPSESKDNQQEIKSTLPPEALGEEIVRLLGERLIVDRSKHKVGEVIVRKEIETRMVQVPIRREKLIVEQVSPERKQLAQIDLGEGEIPDVQLLQAQLDAIEPDVVAQQAESVLEKSIRSERASGAETASLDNGLTVRGEFNSPKIASLLLNAIALERRHGVKKVRVEIIVEDADLQKTYQEWVERSGSVLK